MAMSQMRMEAAQAPQVVAQFLDQNATSLVKLGRRLRDLDPPVVITSARGSSDNAAAYHNYLAGILLGVPCASIGASVVSVYGARLRMKNAACITISQSGRSPDIVAFQKSAREGGALTIALVNDEGSPVAQDSDITLQLCAGPEQSVAATKSFIASLAGVAAIIASWAEDKSLFSALSRLPDSLHEALKIDWNDFTNAMCNSDELYVLGRGPSLPIAEEIALKLKETCAIHAEACSTAEVMHGPLELVRRGFNILSLIPNDAAAPHSRQATAKLQEAGASVFEVGGILPYVRTAHSLLDPISIVQTAYMNIEKLAVSRGLNPDKPRLLNKVTETV
jgi:glutamine---fructose-6-phosphate transaminase (isomerizing)